MQTEESITKIGRALAESLQTELRPFGPEAAVAEASAAVVRVGASCNGVAEFGERATDFAAKSECPVLVVRPGSRGLRPGSTT